MAKQNGGFGGGGADLSRSERKKDTVLGNPKEVSEAGRA